MFVLDVLWKVIVSVLDTFWHERMQKWLETVFYAWVCLCDQKVLNWEFWCFGKWRKKVLEIMNGKALNGNKKCVLTFVLVQNVLNMYGKKIREWFWENGDCGGTWKCMKTSWNRSSNSWQSSLRTRRCVFSLTKNVFDKDMVLLSDFSWFHEWIFKEISLSLIIARETLPFSCLFTRKRWTKKSVFEFSWTHMVFFKFFCVICDVVWLER